MLKHQRIVDIAVALSVAAFASTSAAQQARPGPDPSPVSNAADNTNASRIGR